ncbi:MAG: Type 1 glutamine amidotransferase-like domain-containing protein [Bdellovibrionota bacterium]
MKLVLYSGGFSKDNQALAMEVGDLLRHQRQPLVTFVPGNSEDADCDFRDFKRTMAPSNLKRFLCIPVDQPLSGEDEAALLASDAIFLGGGNTFYLLHHLRERKLLGKLRAYVRDGGLLMGLSAGSILMTPNVMTAEVPSLDSDENEVGLKDYSALDLVPFEFSPHYRPNRKGDAELLSHSKRSKRPIYACADGEGIVVRDGTIRFVGRVTVFHRGHKYNLQ